MAKNGRGNSRQRVIAHAEHPTAPQVESPARVIVPAPKSGWERFVRVFENNIVLAVMSTIGSLLGLFIDGRWFLSLCLPVALGMHRSAALSDLHLKKQLVIYSMTMLASTLCFWWIGVNINKAREHFPTVKEIGDVVGKTPSAVRAQDRLSSAGQIDKATEQQFTLSETKLEPDSADKSPGANHPGVRIVLTARETIKYLNFVAKCDIPCFFSRGESPTNHFEYLPGLPIGDPRIATERILAPTELRKGQQLILYFRARVNSSVSVLTINDYPVPGVKLEAAAPTKSPWQVIASCPRGFSVGYLSDSVFDGGKGVGITTAANTCLIVDGKSYVRGDAGAVCLGCTKTTHEIIKPAHQP